LYTYVIALNKILKSVFLTLVRLTMEKHDYTHMLYQFHRCTHCRQPLLCYGVSPIVASQCVEYRAIRAYRAW